MFKAVTYSVFRIGEQGSFDHDGFTFRARADADPVRINSKLGRGFLRDDRNRLAQILMFRFADSYFRNLPESAEVFSLDKALNVLLDIDIENHNDALSWDPMMAANRVFRYLFIKHIVSDLLRYKVQLHTIGRLDDRILVHANRLLVMPIPSNNHGLQALHAKVALAKFGYTGFSLESTTTHLADQFLEKFNDEGFYEENSSEYHIYGTQLLETFNGEGWYENTKLPDILNDALDFINTLFAAPKEAFSFGDSDRTLLRRQVEKGVINVESSEFVTTKLRVLKTSGIVLSRLYEGGESSSLLLTNGYQCSTHNHHDYMSIEWYCDNDWILIDPGKHSYDGDDFSKYIMSDYSHNTLTLSDLEHNYRKSKKIVAGEKLLEGGHKLEAEIKDANFSVSRDVTHNKKEIFVRDIFTRSNTENKPVRSSMLIGESFNYIESQGERWIRLSNDNGKVLTIKSGLPIEVYRGCTDSNEGWYAQKYRTKKECYKVFSKFESIDGATNTFSLQVDVLDFNIDIKFIDGKLYVENDIKRNLECAFYLYKNGEKIDTRWYSHDKSALFEVELNTNDSYSVLGFIKISKGNVLKKRSKKLP
jgi:hypothetical protein